MIEIVEEKEKCCFCGKEIVGWGNNPYPASKEGRCCDECNVRIVIPIRIMMWSKEA